MNRTKPEQRATVLQLLCKRMSTRAIERATRVTKQTIISGLKGPGRALADYHRAFLDPADQAPTMPAAKERRSDLAHHIL